MSKTIDLANGKKEFSASTDLILAKNSLVNVTAAAHPFKLAADMQLVIPEGATLEQIFLDVQAREKLCQEAVIYIDGMKIPRENWKRVRPKGNHNVMIRAIPMGGGGKKNPLRTILTIAVIVASVYFGPQLGAAILGGTEATIAGITVTASALGGGIITTLGGLVVNSLFPVRPPKMGSLSGTSSQDSPTLFISGARNRSNLFGVLPTILGRHKRIPEYGALPFSEIVGNDQYLNLVFVWGEGPLQVQDIKIGETPIEDFADVEIFTRSGFSDDPGLRIYKNDVHEEALSVLIKESDGYVSRFTQADADIISVDVVFVQGLVKFDDAGTKTNTTVQFRVEYALEGTDNFVTAPVNFADRNSPAMPPAAAAKNSFNYTNATSTPTFNPKRYDAVVLDKVTGDIEIITGETTYDEKRKASYQERLAGAEVDINGYIMVVNTPVRPSIPDTKIGIAYVYRDTGSVIGAEDITDIRPAGSFGGPSDFLPEAQGTPNDTILVKEGTLQDIVISVTNKTSSAVRRNIRFKTPAPGRYEVRLKRITADTTESSRFDAMTWATLRTISNRLPFDPTGLATTELRIKATDQLNAVIDQLSGICTSILPDWDSEAEEWVVRPTQNPASHFRAVLQGPGNKRPVGDEFINLPVLQHWHEFCDEANLKFNMVRDFVTSLWDALSDVAAAGYASPMREEGKYGVVIDEVKTVATQHITPRNSSDFTFERRYPERPHGWRIRFPNEDMDFKQDERIVYFTDYSIDNATKFEPLELPGVTDPDQILLSGRRRAVESLLRPENFTLKVDFEYLSSTRGSMIYINHDVISVGLNRGRIKSIELNEDGEAISMISDELLQFEPDIEYAISVRTISNRGYVARVTSAFPETNEIFFLNPIPEADIPPVGSLFSFGEAGSETMKVLVTNIETESDISARLTLVPYADGLFESDLEGIPEYVPNISLPAGTTRPFILNMRSDEEVLSELPSGVLVPQILVTLARPSVIASLYKISAVEINYKQSDEELYTSLVVPGSDIGEIYIPNVEQAADYDIRARYLYSSGTEGEWTAVYHHTVIGMTTPPPDINALVIEGDFVRGTYTNPPRDLAGFYIRTAVDPFANWDQAFPAHTGILQDLELNITNFSRVQRVWLAKAVDVAGNVSVNEIRLVRDIGQVPVDNIIETIDWAALSFPGVITGADLVSGQLEASETTEYLTDDNQLYLQNDAETYLASIFESLVYTTDELPVQAEWLPASLSVQLEVEGNYIVEYRIGISPLYLPVNTDLYLADDDAEYLPASYSDGWRPFPDYIDAAEGDILIWRVTIAAGESQGKLINFRTIADVEDESEVIKDAALAAIGSRLTLTKIYRELKIINITLKDDGGSAVNVLILDEDPDLGPLLQPIDSTRTGTTATIDAIIQGIKG